MIGGKIGIILRAFAKNPTLVQGQVDSILKALKAIEEVAPQFIHSIDVDIVIPTNPLFVDVDCGLLASALAEAVGPSDFASLYVGATETKLGLFCGALNEALISQVVRECTHSFVISTGCAGHITPCNMLSLMEAFNCGALATGLAIGELESSILEGRLANTFAGYDIKSLFSVGGFDLRCENAYVSDPKKLSGVEEIPLLLRLALSYGRCIKPILPEEATTWVLPTDPDGLARHNVKMESKFRRQASFAEQLGCSLDAIKNGVMP